MGQVIILFNRLSYSILQINNEDATITEIIK
jgi:hypothetical protein